MRNEFPNDLFIPGDQGNLNLHVPLSAIRFEGGRKFRLEFVVVGFPFNFGVNFRNHLGPFL